MISRAAFIWMLLAITAGIGLFVLKYDVKSMEEELAQINRETLNNLAAVHVLKAEWSFLNRPARLEDLGRRLLSLEPTAVSQSAAITDIPLSPIPSPPSATPEAQTPHNISNDSPDAREASEPVRKISPAAGQVPPLLATYRRAQ